MFVNPAISRLDSASRMTGSARSGDLTNANFFNGVGNMFSGNLDYQRDLQLQDIGNQFTALENQKNRDFEERLSNTAYQRAVDDIRKAGLNPYLLYNSGRSLQASTPSASSASGQIPTRGHSGKGFDLLISLLPAFLNYSAMTSNAALQAQTSLDVAKIKASNAYDIQHLKYKIAQLYTGNGERYRWTKK